MKLSKITTRLFGRKLFPGDLVYFKGGETQLNYSAFCLVISINENWISILRKDSIVKNLHISIVHIDFLKHFERQSCYEQ